MSKKLLIFLIVSMIFTTISGCGMSKKSECKQFEGIWSSSENVIGTDTYSGYLSLSVDGNNWSMVDSEAGNPSMDGIIKEVTKNTISLNCNEIEFDAPSGWRGMSSNDTIEYEFVTDDVMILTYDEARIAFFRNVDYKPLPDKMRNTLFVTDINGQKCVLEAGSNELVIYKSYNTQEQEVILYGRQAKYNSYDGKLTFVIDITSGFEAPIDWPGIEEKIQQLEVDVAFESDVMTWSYEGNVITFYEEEY